MSYVYIAGFSGTGDLIKIGITTDPCRRFKQLGKVYGEVTDNTFIVKSYKGYKQLEKLLHANLVEYKSPQLGDGGSEFFVKEVKEKALQFIKALDTIDSELKVFNYTEYLEYKQEIMDRREKMALNLNNADGQAIDTINLSKVVRGERINLSKTQPSLKNVLVKLVWEGEDLDATVVLLNDTETFIRKNDKTSMVFYDNLSGKGITHAGDVQDGGTEEVTINLDKVEDGVGTLLFVATSHAEEARDKVTFGQVRNAKAYIVNADTNKALYEIDLEEDHSTATAVEMTRLYKKNGEWRLTSLEENVGTHHMGLQAILDKYNK